MRLPKKLQGFTLIELLVVISIIAILMAVGTVSYTQVQKRARNQDRKSELALIATALQRYYQDHKQYPNTGGKLVSGNYWDASDGRFQGAGRTCNTGSTDESLCCLFGGPTARNLVSTDSSIICRPSIDTGNIATNTYNKYLDESNRNVRADPLWNAGDVNWANDLIEKIYNYASDGQTYVLATRLYEGTAPAKNALTIANEPFYYCEFVDEVPSTVWSNQYYIGSPNKRVPSDAEKALRPNWQNCG